MSDDTVFKELPSGGRQKLNFKTPQNLCDMSCVGKCRGKIKNVTEGMVTGLAEKSLLRWFGKLSKER